MSHKQNTGSDIERRAANRRGRREAQARIAAAAGATKSSQMGVRRFASKARVGTTFTMGHGSYRVAEPVFVDAGAVLVVPAVRLRPGVPDELVEVRLGFGDRVTVADQT